MICIMKNNVKKYFIITLVIALLASLVCSFAAKGEDTVCVPKISGSYVVGIAPETTFDALVEVTPNIIIDVTKKDGTVLSKNSDKLIATGDDVRINGSQYTAIVLGDVNCDGTINDVDVELLKRNMQLGSVPQNISSKLFLKAALCGSSAEKADLVAYLKLRRHVDGTYDIYQSYKKPASSIGSESGWSDNWN